MAEEKIDNIVKTNVEKLQTQLKKIVPYLNKYIKLLKDSLNNIVIKGIVPKIQQAVQQVKQKVGEVRNTDVDKQLQLQFDETMENAWNYNSNGDAMVQNLANAFNNLLTAINNVIQNPQFQEWLNNCSDKFRIISEKIASINWQPLINSLTQIGTSIGTLVIDILSGLVGIFKWLAENPMVAEILLAIAVAIGVVSTAIVVISTAYEVWTTVTTALTLASSILGISMSGLIIIIVLIIAVIALVVWAIMNWNTVTQALSNTWEWIKQKAQEIWNTIAEFFTNLWNSICEIAMTVWNVIKEFFISIWTGISEFFGNIWNGIKNVAMSVWNAITTTISNLINGIKNTISNVLNGISAIWSNIWNGIKNVITSVWNGIWGIIKAVINNILSGIEGFVNGVIRGINWVLSGISKIASAVGSLIGLDPINLQISTISLPRLAKGAVLRVPTIAEMAEYPGASTNPEIITPQNIMEETFNRVLSRYQNNDNNQPIYLTVNVGNTKLGQILLEDLRNKKRRTGKGIEALIGG